MVGKNHSDIFIRFKDIPEDEISGVYDGDNGKIRDESGVCCFECIERDGSYRIILPSVSDGPFQDLRNFMSSHKNYPIYLVTGDVVGTGTYNEPTLKNVKIIKKLAIKELYDPKPKFKLDRRNVQLVDYK